MKRLVIQLSDSPARPRGLSGQVEFFQSTCRELWSESPAQPTESPAQPTGIEVRRDPQARPFAFKVGRGGRLKRWLRCRKDSRSKRALVLGDHLVASGVSTPRALACLEERWGAVVLRDALVMEYIEAPTLLERLGSSSAEAWLRSAAETIYAMHAARVRHRDLKAANLLAVEEVTTPSTRELQRVLVVDLDGARLLRKLPSFEARVRDLARLAVSTRLLGLRDGAEGPYAELAGWSESQRQEARVQIDAYEAKKVAANRRRGRELT